ncbi:MAG: hypothetical protein R3Y65_04210 [Bacillota bacterium]
MDNRPKNVNEKLNEIQLKLDAIASQKTDDRKNLKKTIYSCPSLDQNKYADVIKSGEKYFVYTGRKSFRQNKNYIFIFNLVATLCLFCLIAIFFMTASEKIWVAIILLGCSIIMAIHVIKIMNMREVMEYDKFTKSIYYRCGTDGSGLPAGNVTVSAKLKWAYFIGIIFSCWVWILISNSGNLVNIWIPEAVPYVLWFIYLVAYKLASLSYTTFLCLYNVVYVKGKDAAYSYYIKEDRFIKEKKW